MQSKRITMVIFTAFIAGTLLLVYIEYNTSKNIDKLITGNEKLIDEFKVNAELDELVKDIVTVESQIRGAVTTGDKSHLDRVDQTIAEVNIGIDHLQKVTDDDTSVRYIDLLDTLVNKKIFFSHRILDTLARKGKTAAEKLIATQQGKRLTDSIFATASKLDSTRKKHLSDATMSIDKSGKNAQQFSLILIVMVLTGSAVLFWYIINTIRRQIALIHQLDASEKLVKETIKVKENFMANMSHEIRTPMNAILGFTYLLQRKKLDAVSKEYVDTIQRSGENLLTIINDVLDLSKIEAGMMRIEAVPFGIRELLHSVEVMFASKAKEKEISFHVTVEEKVPDLLVGDATRLTQILINLIGNALKFTQQGSISIHIFHGGNFENVINTGIRITDTGIGIDAEKQKHIFNRFQQADDSVTRNYGGTGLGLSIVKELVVLQKGTIEVESEPGAGTTFVVTLPYHIAQAQPETPINIEKEDLARQDFGDMKVLVVEDNEINQSLIRHLFGNWGLDYVLVQNGVEAIEKLTAGHFDLVLMDIQMPVMDGYTATQVVRETLGLNIPIIAMTAHALSGEREKCLSYGMNDYISKPLREAQLHKLIASYAQVLTPALLPADVRDNAKTYQYINLQYMKEISGGSKTYEKTVTEQFIEMVPEDLLAIETAWKQQDITALRQLAHNLKSSVSIMGIDTLLQHSLDALEYEDLSEKDFIKHFDPIKSICSTSVNEAKQFLQTLS